jgi:hypothetical protein
MANQTDITFNFVRYGEHGNEVDNFTMSFSNDNEDLGVMLHNMKVFLEAMSFITDGKRLELVTEDHCGSQVSYRTQG